MLKSKLYAEYFPVKENYTHFSEDEKNVLCKWVRSFNVEVLARDIDIIKSGCGRYATYDLSKFDMGIMLDMISHNRFDDKYLSLLNIILYRHKYNAFFSIWIFPVLTKEKALKNFGEITS